MEIITNDRLKKSWKLVRAFLVIGSILAIFFIFAIIGFFTYGIVSGPPPLSVPQTTIFYGDDQSIIGESHHGEQRYWVDLNDISPTVIQATISIEDKRFYDHNGFDFIRIAGAALADIKAMAKVEGASTITQQYARNLYLEHNKSWKRKFYEALYAIRLETNYSKDRILEGYLNTIYYGHGTYGIEAAANYYFNKQASELTLSEASILAGIPKAPSYYSPLKDKERAKQRQKIVLQSMVNNGYITEQQAKKAYEQPLKLYTQTKEMDHNLAPYFLDVVKRALTEKLNIDERLIEMGGLRVYTTLDPELQKQAQHHVKNIIDPNSTIQTAVLTMDPENGEVKALIGGRNYDESPFNRAMQAKRMPGSAFKPFLYYTAIKNGFTPSTRLKSEPTGFRYDDGRSYYKPSNYHNYYAHDFITMAQALALSDNIYAVKTNMFLGPEQLVKTAKQMGITTPLLAVPSLALGSSTVKVIDMVKAYGELVNGGKQLEPVFIKKVVDYNGEVIYEAKQSQKQILDPKAAFVTAHMMTGMFDPSLNDYTSVTGSSILNKINRAYGGKSGTTETDSWMIGFSPQLVTGVWVGYDKNKSIDLIEEKRYAKEIWAAVMNEAHHDLPVQGYKPPEGVVGKYINPDNGKLATKACPTQRLVYYIEGTEPTQYCTDHLQHNQPQPQPKNPAEKEKKGWFDKILDWFS